MQIDPGIKPLVDLLNDKGYKTIGSCQGGPGHPSITSNPSSRPGRAFVSVEGTEDDETEKIDELVASSGYSNYKVKHIQWPGHKHGCYLVRFSGALE